MSLTTALFLAALAGAAILAARLAARRLRAAGRSSVARSATDRKPRDWARDERRLEALPEPASPTARAFDIGYAQTLRCDGDGVRIDTRDLTLSRRAEAHRLFGDTVFIPWSRIERIDVKSHRGLGVGMIDAAEYLFHLVDGEQRMPDVTSFDALRRASTDGAVNRWLISRLETLIDEDDLSSLTRAPVSIERDERAPGHEGFLDYCRSVGRTPVVIHGPSA